MGNKKDAYLVKGNCLAQSAIHTVITWYKTVDRIAKPQPNDIKIMGLANSFSSSINLLN